MSEQKLVDLNKTFDCDWEQGRANNRQEELRLCNIFYVVVANEVVVWSILRAASCLIAAFFSPEMPLLLHYLHKRY